MKIPAEFEDIFRGVELTEREARFLSWITSWDDYTIQNMRTVLGKVRSTLSTLQAENEKLRAAVDNWKKKYVETNGKWIKAENKWAGLDKAVRNGNVYRPMQEELNLTHEENQSLKYENEKLRAELEQVKRALAMMWFAYVNSDKETPHSYETDALEEAEHILGPWAKCMPKYLRRGPKEG